MGAEGRRLSILGLEKGLVDDGEGAKQPDSWRLLTPKLSDWGGRGESPLDFGAGVCGGPVVVVAPPAFMGVCGNGSFENAWFWYLFFF